MTWQLWMIKGVARWHLWICFINVDRLTSCLRTFARPVETGTSPPKRLPVRLGGDEGSRTPVQNASRLPELQPYGEWYSLG